MISGGIEMKHWFILIISSIDELHRSSIRIIKSKIKSSANLLYFFR